MTTLIAPRTSEVAPDAELVQLARAGDRDAFRELFDRHRDRVAGVCRQRLRSSSDVDDAVQDAFVRALANLGQLRDPAQFGSWVRSIAVRACLDHHRTARRVVSLEGEASYDLPDAAPLPDEVLMASERAASVRGYLAQIGERDARALWMRHVAEAPVSAVADEFGLTEGSTRVMLARARQRLRAVAYAIAGVVLVPWRQWLRDLVQAPAVPAIEGLAVAFAILVSGGVASAGASTPAPASTAVAPVSAPAVMAPAPMPPVDAAAPVAEPAAPVAVEVAPAAPGSDPVAPPPAPANDPLDRIEQSVEVSNEYPDEDEATPVADVAIPMGPDDNSLTLYAEQLETPADASAAAIGVLGVAGA